MHRSPRQIRTFAVKVEGEGWIGVAVEAGRCHGHGHQTPELAKLCALHRAQPAGLSGGPGDNVVLLPVAPPTRRERRRAAGS